MMISTKGRYALRVMVDIAENQRDGYIPLKEIAYRQDISEKYLEAIVKGLVKERYLTGLRGKSGGYRLTRAPEDYTCALPRAAWPPWPAWSRSMWTAPAWRTAAPCPCGAS